ncbi:hypothetical protein SA2016_0918 [Sinomonas atrocyanea]|uniref:HPt domain-containing protein n=1 Tax=Sinomonas atrocyanea TaxID=37927 RepID=A0A126ZYX7_9MICC|nr:hypothetical protein SA2016_0918 [Sinomonas atrocyanea]
MDGQLCSGGAPPGLCVPALVDRAVLAELEADIPGAGRRFAAEFVRLWAHRYARIAGAVAAGSREEALDAVLSLKVSSMMVGAHPLASRAAALEGFLRSGEGNAGPLCAQIAECGTLTVASLRTAWVDDCAH